MTSDEQGKAKLTLNSIVNTLVASPVHILHY